MAIKLDPLLEEYLSGATAFGFSDLLEVIVEYFEFPDFSDVSWLENIGAIVTGGSKILPVLYATVSKNMIFEIEKNPKVRRISLSGGVTPL